MKKTNGFLSVLCVLLIIIISASSEPVTKNHYVFLDYSGEYTGSVDTNGIPFGYGLFVCNTPVSGEAWHYIGMWEDGLPDGEGAIYYENGNMEKGTFSKGILMEGYRFSISGLSITPVIVERTMSEAEVLYIGNKNSLKFHLPTCKSVALMKDKNKIEFFSREEAIERGYKPCGECNP